jgi:hypothetical protein
MHAPLSLDTYRTDRQRFERKNDGLEDLLRASLNPREAWATAWWLARTNQEPGMYATASFRRLCRKAKSWSFDRNEPTRLEDNAEMYRAEVRRRATMRRPELVLSYDDAPRCEYSVETERWTICDGRRCECGVRQ